MRCPPDAGCSPGPPHPLEHLPHVRGYARLAEHPVEHQSLLIELIVSIVMSGVLVRRRDWRHNRTFRLPHADMMRTLGDGSDSVGSQIGLNG